MLKAQATKHCSDTKRHSKVYKRLLRKANPVLRAKSHSLYMGAIRWRTRGTRPPILSDSGIYYDMSRTFFSLGFVIYWFHTKLSPSHFTTKLRSCLYRRQSCRILTSIARTTEACSEFFCVLQLPNSLVHQHVNLFFPK